MLLLSSCPHAGATAMKTQPTQLENIVGLLVLVAVLLLAGMDLGPLV
ncbi:hypothetical protein TspCOW1_33320 [Thiohalobacter sp. COW1]|uniref:Uncharacterized protein n=1 Tax=Thiohalobacter thiocyanaticus TaxID=585455 RepID=A0A1Z4VU22_9GAMM|nr:uncharacterized protein FOKN1_2476 [Thiohalobacter thiocyanaticus]BCO33229.1 hypothetical protein TspCOW1_33320 [Thiohalobacter sp. COW1]